MNRRNIGSFLLRLTLGIIFLYTGVSKVFMHVTVPPISKVITFLPAARASMVLGIIELIVGVLLIIGLWTRLTGWVAAVLLLCFIISGSILGLFQSAALMKDVGLLGSALYLGFVGARSHSIDTRDRATKE